ncbi:AAA family ATPase [Streptosporangium sp. NBC_01495]|uniref:helix-turn-helix transcriptional regulator n=1 Tax=Streptosporangium sp. NBC_01495 TaxID=2903899 RepID=UPI002E2FC415|nr:AAA family ATPase [Streptosporangium sp. NBC_01495]
MRAHTVSPLFVGRADELAILEGALARARSGAASTVFVGGEAGVGKTRLIREFATRADATVLIGGCLELGTEGLPFAPFTAVLRGLARDLGHDGVAALLPGGSTRGLARLLPEFGEPEREGAEARARLFEQVLGLLERLAETRPTVLVIEDAHWADRSTRDLLSFLVRYQRTDARLLTLVTYRADELHRTHPLRPLLAELSRVDWVARLDLRRLSRREVDQQAASILDGGPVADLDLVYARSEGNPLFVEALLSGGEGETLPDSLRDLLLASVERLPEETQELMRLAAAGGARIEHAMLSAVAGADEGELSRLLRPAVAGNVLVVDGETYAFRHALIREAVHDDLLPGERTRLHTRFAEALEVNPGILPAPRGAIELAHHWHAAHNSLWALISAWHAAAAARKTAAYDEQLRMLTRVLELWEAVPDAAERIAADHVDVLRQAVTVAHLAGEFERGISLARAALREIDTATDPIRAARLLRQRGLVRYDLGRAGFVEDLRAAAALVPAEPPTSLRAQVLENLARVLGHPRDRAEKEATAEEAMRIAQEVGDADAEAHALVTLTWASCRYSQTEDRLAAFARAREIAGRAGTYHALMRAVIFESDALEGAGRHEQAAEVARRGVADAEVYGLARTSGAFLAINLAEPLVSLGRWDEASEVVEHALEVTPPPPYRASLQGLVTDIALARGDLDRAGSLFQASRAALAPGTHRDQTVLPQLRREIELLVARGRDDEASALVGRTLDEHDLETTPRYVWPLLRACLPVAVSSPSPLSPLSSSLSSPPSPSPSPSSSPVLSRLRAVAEKLGVEGELQRAHSLTFEAEAAQAEGAPDREAWRAAVAAWAALRQPYAEARALLGAARAAVAAGERDEAALGLPRAAELAARLGASPLAAEIGSLARRARIALPGEPVSAEPAPGEAGFGLTAREHEVLGLVAAGRSNREIAGELFISAKTVSVHVSNILAKLGAASRGEAAATAHRLRLFER